jgi:hypothetical protein
MDSSYVGISGYSSPFFDLSHGNMVSWRQNSGAVNARVPWHSFPAFGRYNHDPGVER